MKKILFFIIFSIFLTYNITDSVDKQSVLNESINNDKTNYSYVGFINKNSKEVDNNKLKEYLVKNKIKTMQIKSSENKTLKRVYFPESSDNDYLHLNKDEDLKESHTYSNECEILNSQCEKINYTIEGIEYHYLFDYFDNELNGNYFFKIDDNLISEFKKKINDFGYDIKIEKNVGYIDQSIDYFNKTNIISIVKENLISIIIFVFMSNYLIAKKSKKIGIQILLGESKNKIIRKIIKDFTLILISSYLFVQTIYFFFLIIIGKGSFVNFRGSLILLITLAITSLTVIIFNGVIALNQKTKGLIKNGYKSSNFFVIFSTSVQILLIVISSLSLAQILRLETYKDALYNVYDSKGFEKYSKNKNIVPFSFNQFEIFKDSIGSTEENKKTINDFLKDIKYSYSSDLYKLNNIDYGNLNERNINEVLVDTNNEFLKMNNFNEGCEECVLVGNNRKLDFEKNKKIFQIIFKDRYGNKKIDDFIKYYDDSKEVELLRMNLKDDSASEKLYKSPIFFVRPTIEIVEHPILKKNLFQGSGVPSMYFIDCRDDCENDTPTDKLINKIIKHNMGTKIEKYTDIMYEYKQEKILTDQFIFKTILEVVKVSILSILVILLSISIFVETIKRKIGISFVLGCRPIDILKEYCGGVFVIFLFSFIGSKLLNQIFFDSGFIFFNNEQIIISLFLLLIMYFGIFYTMIYKEFKDKKMSIRLKGDM